jgi:hypothetical protein
MNGILAIPSDWLRNGDHNLAGTIFDGILVLTVFSACAITVVIVCRILKGEYFDG